MILKIGSDFYNCFVYNQIRKKYSTKVSWNNFEVTEIFQKTRKLKIIAFCSKRNADIIQYQLKELKKLKQALQLNV